MPPPHRLPPDDAVDLARRAVATGAVASAVLVAGGALLAGCGAAEEPASGAVPTGDEVLLVAALRAEEEALREVRAVRRRHASLRDRLAATEAVHQRHRTLLRGALPAGSPTSPGPSPTRDGRSPAADLEALTRSERQLSVVQARVAMSADSGALARLVAGLSAAAAQQAEVVSALAVRAAPSSAGSS